MRERLLANSIMLLALVCAVGSLTLFIGFPVASQGAIALGWPQAGLLAWDALLSCAFFLQHSGMLRRRFRIWSARLIPPRYQRAVYSIASGVVLAAVAMLWQRCGEPFVVLEGPWRWAAHGVALLAVAIFIWGAFALQNLDLFGLAPIQAYLRGRPEPASEFVFRGPYRWVRHPWYLCAILLFWSSPELTADRLLFNVLWTAWILIGTRLEEADLLSTFGPAYAAYRRRVPMLIPWRGPAPLQGRSAELGTHSAALP